MRVDALFLLLSALRFLLYHDTLTREKTWQRALLSLFEV
jgi:hypothetical protein